jgi:hypothetical protein
VIRPATIEDLNWIVALAHEAHPPSIAHLDEKRTRGWFEALLTAPHVVALRGEHSAAFAVVSAVPWDAGEINCELIHLFSRPRSAGLEAFRMLREVRGISEARGCRKFYIASTEADLTPFALRLGARPCGSLHVLERAA